MPRTLSRINHYVPPRDFKPYEPEFVEPRPDDNFIWWLFRYRCMECKKPGQEINEIIPRSRDRKAIMRWRNRVVLCRECHEKFHHGGVTDEKIAAMKETRRAYLTAIGRGRYW